MGRNKFRPEQYTDVDLRKNAYVIAMSGAALNFGDMNGDPSSGFSDIDVASALVEAHPHRRTRQTSIELRWGLGH